MKLGKAMKIARIKKDFSQSQLGEVLGVSSNYISMLENDRRDPSWSFICKLCDVLSIPIPMLLLLASEEALEERNSDPVKSAVTQQLVNLLSSVSNSRQSNEESQVNR